MQGWGIFIKMLLDYSVSTSRWHILHRVIKGKKRGGEEMGKKGKIPKHLVSQHHFASSRQSLTKKRMHLQGSIFLKQILIMHLQIHKQQI